MPIPQPAQPYNEGSSASALGDGHIAIPGLEFSSLSSLFCVKSARRSLGEAHQQYEWGHGQNDRGDLIAVERFPEEHHPNGSQQQYHRNGVDNADGGQFEVSHHENPSERGRSIDGEPDIKPTRP